MKKIVAFILAICIMMGTGFTAFADGESNGSVEELPSTGYRTIVKPNEIAAANRLIAAFDATENQVDLTDCEISVNDFTSMYFSVLYSHPEFFYVDLSYRYSYNVATNMITVVTINYLETYRTANGYDKNQIAADRAKFDVELDKAMAVVRDEMSDLEKVLAIHEYLGGTVCYDYDDLVANTLPDLAYTAYGALVDELAVCQGYSLAFKLLCIKNDIESIYVSSLEGNHGWNMVNIDGEWYHLDLTYDDPVYTCTGRHLQYSVLNHSFFLVSDDDIDDDEHVNYSRPEHVIGETPSASENIEGIWNGQKSQLLYRNGYWYYVNGGDIVKSKIDGSDFSVVVKNAGLDIRLTTNGSSILFSTRDGVYAANYDGSDVQELYVSDGNRVHGLYYKDGMIYAEIHNPNDGDPIIASIRYDEVKTSTLPEGPKTEEAEDETVEDFEDSNSNEEIKNEENEENDSNNNDSNNDVDFEDDLDSAFFVITIGDLDNDGSISVSDILALKNLLMNDSTNIEQLAYADCDGDGSISVSDIIWLKSLVMGG